MRDPQDSNPFEVGTFNLTRAVQMARTDSKQARTLFNRALRRGTLAPSLERAEAELFPAPKEDPYAWADPIGQRVS
jgi:hypothetical protein